MADLLFSFQVALPSLIRDAESDTEIPRNLYDEDFDEDCKELPPARPSNEPTPIAYLAAKARLTQGFGRVLERTQSVTSPSYEAVMEADSDLRRAQEMVPDHLRIRPIQECARDTATMIISRFHVRKPSFPLPRVIST
jgi:hypothetical protein